MKTTLRYLLIIVAMVSVLGVCAQGLAKQPEAKMQSTSVMVGAGTTLPFAATEGIYVTGSTPGTYTPATSHRPGHIRKGDWNPGEEPGPDEGENSEPWEDPIGDGLWVLILAAAVYGVYRRKRV